MQKYSTVKIGLFSFLMAAVGIVNAVCVSIDKFVAPNGRKIYLFGDVHLGNQDMILKEQNAFIAAAKERGAHCIVEDMMSYEGNDFTLRQTIDDQFYQKMMNGDTTLSDDATALSGLANRCLASGISCFNAEWRHAMQLFNVDCLKRPALQATILDKMYDDADTLFDKMRAYNDVGLTYKKALSYFTKGLKSSIRYAVDSKKRDRLDITFIVITKRLFDAYIVHHIYQSLLNQHNRRDIFVFAGWRHTHQIGCYLKECMGCSAYKSDIDISLLKQLYSHEKVSNYTNKTSTKEGISIMQKAIKAVSSDDNKLKQEAARHDIVTMYGVDIAAYFELDNAVEKMTLQEAQLKEEETRNFIKEKMAKRMIQAREEAIELE